MNTTTEPHPARLVMVARRLSIAEAARRMEVHPTVLGRWLSGSPHERMPLARRNELARLLDWPADEVAELFHDDAPRPRAHQEAAHAR